MNEDERKEAERAAEIDRRDMTRRLLIEGPQPLCRCVIVYHPKSKTQDASNREES